MTKIMTACVWMLMLVMHFSVQVMSATNDTKTTATPSGAGISVLPTGLSLLLPLGLLGALLRGRC